MSSGSWANIHVLLEYIYFTVNKAIRIVAYNMACFIQ